MTFRSDNNNQKPDEQLFENRIWMNTNCAASYLCISAKTLRNMTSNGQVTYYKLGNRNRYLKSDLDNLLFTNRRGGYNGH